MTKQPSATQVFVLARLAEGWVLSRSIAGTVLLDGRGSVRRHVNTRTFEAMVDQGWIKPDANGVNVNRFRISEAGRNVLPAGLRESVPPWESCVAVKGGENS